MKYRQFRIIWTHSATLLLFAMASGSSVCASNPMAPLPGELENLVPSLAARRLSARDFAQSRQGWAAVHGYRKLEARVCQINREGSWVRIDFDRTREGKQPDKEVYRMAWNEGETGPAPFARNQRVWIWVSPDGSVDGCELGQAVHRWRHQPDGTVELQVLDEMVDGGTVLVRMIPDRYSGSEVGKTVYWKGEGLCTGAAGEIPLGRKIHPDDLQIAQADLGPEAKKSIWVSPGMTSCEDEIRILLRSFADRAVVADAAAEGREPAEPFKIRLKAESSSAKKASGTPSSHGGTGWGRTSAPPAARKNPGGSVDVNAALFSLFGKGNKEKEATEKAQEKEKEGRGQSQSKSSQGVVPEPEGAGKVDGVPAPGAAAPSQAVEQPAKEVPAAVQPERVRFDERWFDLLREKALDHRRQAFETLSSSRSPGSAVSSTWVDVTYESPPGEPLKAAVRTLPLVPKKQFVPESRALQ